MREITYPRAYIGTDGTVYQWCLPGHSPTPEVYAPFLSAETTGRYSVNVELSKSKANVGDELQVTCSVSSELNKQDGAETNYPLIVWVKRVDNTEVEIGTNNYLNNDFKKSGRYIAGVDYEYDDAKEVDLSQITFMLTIKGA